MDDITRFLVRSRDVVQAALDSPDFIATCGTIVDCLETCFRSDRKLLIAGNGGSAGDAQHIASEFLSRLNVDRAPLPAFALTTDTSVLTAISNDYGYDRSFERQILGLGQPGDVFIAISTSGRSANILRAMAAARERGLTVVAFTSRDGGGMPDLSDLALRVPSQSTPLIQQLHITAAHIICGLVEARMFPGAAS